MHNFTKPGIHAENRKFNEHSYSAACIVDYHWAMCHLIRKIIVHYTYKYIATKTEVGNICSK